MKFYDLDLQSKLSDGESTVAELIESAERFGFSGIVICDKPENLRQLKEMIEIAKPKIEVYAGVKIEAKDANEMRNVVNRVREDATIVIVSGGNYEINRAACENPKVDILAHPEKGRIEGGLDDVCINMAAKNNVAIEVNFRELLYTYRRNRAYNLTHIAKNIELCKELGASMVICSGAKGKWDMRDPRELIAMGNVLGMELDKAFAAASTVPQLIIERNKAKLEGRMVTEGVEVVG